MAGGKRINQFSYLNVPLNELNSFYRFMKYPLVILLVMATSIAGAQRSPDSVASRLQDANQDKLKVKTLEASANASTKSRVDSLHDLLQHAAKDSTKLAVIKKLALSYVFNQFDSAIFYAKAGIELNKKLNDDKARFDLLTYVLFANNTAGDYSNALKIGIQMKQLAEQSPNRSEKNLVSAYHFIGLVNREMGYRQEALENLRRAIRIREQSSDPDIDNTTAYSQMGLIFLEEKRLDSALRYAQKGVDLDAAEHAGISNGLNLAILGNVRQALGNYALSEKYYREGINGSQSVRYILARLYNNLASLFLERNMSDSCLHYALSSLQLCQKYNYTNYGLDASLIVVKMYEAQGNTDSAYKYFRAAMVAKDSLFSQQKTLQVLMLDFDENNREQLMLAASEKLRNQIRIYTLVGALVVFLVIAFILFRNNRLQKRAKLQIEKAYGDLKSTQAQLIQSEKMASLGELTAGIAHEIQNPLNFVNNFSEVNNELLLEMKDELSKGNPGNANSIADNIISNEQKILAHGKRADAIVKGMLQHSRDAKGQKEPADINALAEEYLRLSYQGFRARDKSFNAALQTHFNQSIGTINIIPQDIARVLLNLYNNAFYAVSEKKKQDADGYDPTVSVSTKKMNDKVEIRVKDNGKGIPSKVVDKIFQPFFTTKPSGQGTGLGLSLSYDIIKAHGGEIKVETREGEESEFIIQLPFQ
jgi:two-component system, NtrC family, sensor kinase